METLRPGVPIHLNIKIGPGGVSGTCSTKPLQSPQPGGRRQRLKTLPPLRRPAAAESRFSCFESTLFHFHDFQPALMRVYLFKTEGLIEIHVCPNIDNSNLPIYDRAVIGVKTGAIGAGFADLAHEFVFIDGDAETGLGR